MNNEDYEDVDKILSLSDDEIEQEHRKYSFDLATLAQRIKGGEPWQQLVQVHLYFEHVVNQMLLEALTNPDEISFSRMGFSQRTDLACALGLIPKDTSQAVKKATRLRNKVAHDLDFQIEDRDIRELGNAMTRIWRETIRDDETVKKTDGEIGLIDLLTAILLSLEVERQTHAVRRVWERRQRIRIKKASEDLRKLLNGSEA